MDSVTGYDLIIELDGLIPKEIALERIKYKYQNDQFCIFNTKILDKYLKFEMSYEAIKQLKKYESSNELKRIKELKKLAIVFVDDKCMDNEEVD